jgi:hypothetical protein
MLQLSDTKLSPLSIECNSYGNNTNVTKSKCSFQFNTALEINDNAKYKISLRQFSSCNLFYNISSSIGNNQFRLITNLIVNGVQAQQIIQLSIPDNRYDFFTLLDLMNSYIASNNQITFQNKTFTTGFMIFPSMYNPSILTFTNFPQVNAGVDNIYFDSSPQFMPFLTLLGLSVEQNGYNDFSNGNYNATAGFGVNLYSQTQLSLFIISLYPIHLCGTKNLKILLDNVSLDNHTYSSIENVNNRNLLAIIPIKESYLDIIQYESKIYNPLYVTSKLLTNSLRIHIYDEDGFDTLNFLNTNWSCVLYIEPFFDRIDYQQEAAAATNDQDPSTGVQPDDQFLKSQLGQVTNFQTVSNFVNNSLKKRKNFF